MTEQNIPILIDRWWGDRSVILSKECALTNLKSHMIKHFKNVLNINMDRRNKTSHLCITNRANAKNSTYYNNMSNKSIKLDENSLNITRHTVEIDTGYSGLIDTHFTVFFSKEDILETYHEPINFVYREWLNSL